MISTSLRLLSLAAAALSLGGCVAVPYDSYYGNQPVYSTYPAYESYPAYPAYGVYPAPAYVAPYSSSFYFGFGGGGGGHRGHWRR